MHKVSKIFRNLSGAFIIGLPVSLMFFMTACAGTDDVMTTNINAKNVVKPAEVTPDLKYDYSHYSKERSIYLDALKAYEAKDYLTVQSLYNGPLKKYPLAVYLEFLMLRDNHDNLGAIKNFINSGKHEILGNRLKAYYIDYFSKTEDYRSVLAVAPEEPVTSGLKCKWFKARYMTGDRKTGVNYLRKNYREGKPIPKQCGDFVSTLESSGTFTKAETWERLSHNYWTKNGKKRYLAAASALKGQGYDSTLKLLSKYYGKPQKYDDIPESQKSAAALVFARYARTDADSAVASLGDFKSKYKPDNRSMAIIEEALAFSLMHSRSNISDTYLDNLLARVGDDSLLQQRIQKAIWDQNWKEITRFVNKLSPEAKRADNMRYWEARALDESGNKAKARELFRNLAKERSFYGFLAADKVGLPYALNEVKAIPANSAKKKQLLSKYPAYVRYMEFNFLNDTKGIKTEWQEIMNKTTLDDARTIAATEALRGFSDLALWESIYKKDWDALNIRFPMPYKNLYTKNAQKYNVKVNFMYGITRQESMMNPLATSPVGARGLMQFMPETASIVSRKYGIPYSGKNDLYNPETIVQLGGAYLRDLLNKFSENRIFVAAGYNAGPGRAIKWQSDDGRYRDAATYIESIPFNETRNYVQKVLLYDVMYQHLLGNKKLYLLTPEEKKASY